MIITLLFTTQVLISLVLGFICLATICRFQHSCWTKYIQEILTWNEKQKLVYLLVNSISRSHFICKTPLSAFVSSYIQLSWSYKYNSIPRLHFISGEGSMFLTVPQQHLWIHNVLSKVGLFLPQKLDFNLVCVLHPWQNYRFSSLNMYDDF